LPVDQQQLVKLIQMFHWIYHLLDLLLPGKNVAMLFVELCFGIEVVQLSFI